jgi:hypothetical protein
MFIPYTFNIFGYCMCGWHLKASQYSLMSLPGTSGGIFCTQSRTFWSHKRRRISWLAQRLLASHEGLMTSCSYTFNMALMSLLEAQVKSSVVLKYRFVFKIHNFYLKLYWCGVLAYVTKYKDKLCISTQCYV